LSFSIHRNFTKSPACEMMFELLDSGTGSPRPEFLPMSSNPQEANKLDRERIVGELKRERDRLNQAIAALEGSSPRGAASKPAGSNQPARGRKRARLTPEGRKRLSDMMKKRWAEVKKRAGKGA
jgi:hypothetical protein